MARRRHSVIAIIAAVVVARCDHFVTHDAQHFLDNRALQGHTSLPIGDPGAFLRWYRSRSDEALSAN